MFSAQYLINNCQINASVHRVFEPKKGSLVRVNNIYSPGPNTKVSTLIEYDLNIASPTIIASFQGKQVLYLWTQYTTIIEGDDPIKEYTLVVLSKRNRKVIKSKYMTTYAMVRFAIPNRIHKESYGASLEISMVKTDFNDEVTSALITFFENNNDHFWSLIPAIKIRNSPVEGYIRYTVENLENNLKAIIFFKRFQKQGYIFIMDLKKNRYIFKPFKFSTKLNEILFSGYLNFNMLLYGNYYSLYESNNGKTVYISENNNKFTISIVGSYYEDTWPHNFILMHKTFEMPYSSGRKIY